MNRTTDIYPPRAHTLNDKSRGIVRIDTTTADIIVTADPLCSSTMLPYSIEPADYSDALNTYRSNGFEVHETRRADGFRRCAMCGANTRNVNAVGVAICATCA